MEALLIPDLLSCDQETKPTKQFLQKKLGLLL